MISNELHLKLIDAGFYGEEAKQVEHFCPFEECCGASVTDLIDKLGDAFECLYRCVKDKNDLSTKDWVAYGFSTPNGGRGSSPEDALATLWLSINKLLTSEK